MGATGLLLSNDRRGRGVPVRGRSPARGGRRRHLPNEAGGPHVSGPQPADGGRAAIPTEERAVPAGRRLPRPVAVQPRSLGRRGSVDPDTRRSADMTPDEPKDPVSRGQPVPLREALPPVETEVEYYAPEVRDVVCSRG